MEVTERGSLRSPLIEAYSRSVRFIEYWSQFVQELGPDRVKFAGAWSSPFATNVMGARSHTITVHFSQ